MDEIMSIAEKHNLTIIEDCAQAVGARYRGRLVGTFGAASFFSFQMLKGINTYGGGMVMSNDTGITSSVREQVNSEPLQSAKDLARRFAGGLVSRIGISPKGFTLWGFPIQATASIFGHYDLSKYIWEKIRALDPLPRSYRQRYSNAQALLGIRGLGKLDAFNIRSRAHAALYTQSLSDCRAIQTPDSDEVSEGVYYQYCVYVSDPALASRRAIRSGVDFETMHVDVCSSLPLFRDFAANCPRAELSAQALQLPVYSRLRDADVERVIRVVRKITADLAPISETGRLPFKVRNKLKHSKQANVS
jgi:dTDP-4-amino-4,6-dideoxygalactose transaminase